MATSLEGAAREFADLAKNLKEVGEGGLRDELYKAINEAAQSLTDEIGSTANLEEHLPDPYAAVLRADLRVSVHKRTTGSDAGVSVVTQAPTVARGRGRAVIRLNAGVIGHPVFGRRSRANPRRWAAWVDQVGGMRAGFVDDVAARGGPPTREAILAAIRRIERKATGKG